MKQGRGWTKTKPLSHRSTDKQGGEIRWTCAYDVYQHVQALIVDDPHRIVVYDDAPSLQNCVTGVNSSQNRKCNSRAQFQPPRYPCNAEVCDPKQAQRVKTIHLPCRSFWWSISVFGLDLRNVFC